MTNEEAINILRMDRKGSFPIDANYVLDNREEALDMAIEALECVNSSAFKDGYKKGREDVISEAICEINKYATVWMAYTDGMTKEQIAQESLNAAKDTIVDILEQMKGENG